MTKKDEKIIKDAERGGIPIFVFTAKDVYSTGILAQYFKDCILGGCDKNHLNGIADRVYDFKEWQLKNYKQTHIPD